jgi:hypothetical protein
MFGSVIAIAFENVFRAEIHQNDIFFYFLKIIFKIIISKRFKKYKIKLFFNQKKIKFLEI